MSRAPRLWFKKIGAASALLLASQLILFLSTWLNSRHLTTLEYGCFGLAMSVSVCAAQFTQWGLDQLLTVKFVRGSADDSRELFGILLRQKQLTGVLVLLAAAVAAALWQPVDERGLIVLGALDGFALGCAVPAAFDARGQNTLWQLFAFARHGCYVAGVVLLAFFFGARFTPLNVLVLHAAAILLEIGLEQLWIFRTYGRPRWPAPVRGAWLLWREGAPLALAMLAQQALFFMGPPALQFFERPEDMGALYLSNQFVVAAASFIVAPAALIHARLAAAGHEPVQGSEMPGAHFERLVWMFTLGCAAAGICYALAFDFAAEKIAAAFFPKYVSAPRIIAADCWRLLPLLASVPLSSALICAGHLRAFALAHCLALLAGVMAAVLWIPAQAGGGGPGAASAIVLGRVVFLVLCAAFFLLNRQPSATA